MAETPQWVLVQKKTFTKWTNAHLRKKSFPSITDISTEFDSGVNLMNLISALYDVPVPKHNKDPKMLPHKLDNIALAFKMIDDCKIKTNFLKPNHLTDHDEKMILGMIWAIILDYQIKGISVEELSAREGLLLWCQRKTEGYRDVKVENFSTSFKSGLAFCALIHKFRPDLLDYDVLDVNNAEHNLKLAFEVADKQLGIPQLLDVEDMLIEKPDEKSVMTYVSEYFHKFSQMEKYLEFQNKVKKFCEVVKVVTESKAEYDKKAPPHVQWLNNKIAELERTDDVVENPDKLKNLMFKLKEFGIERARLYAERLQLHGTFALLDSNIRANNLPAYKVPAGCSIDHIQELWDRLEKAEQFRSTTLRDKLSAHFEKAFKQFDKENKGRLKAHELKACLASLGEVLTPEELAELLTEVDENGEKYISFPQFINFMISRVQHIDSAVEIKRAFRLIANERDFVTGQQLEPVLNNADVHSFTVRTMPPKGSGFDYVEFVDAQFRD